jgi:hypothetical protein
MRATTFRVSELMAMLQPDPWRQTNPFAEDMQKCHTVLFDPRATRQQKMTALSDWLADSQPCQFGQMEAKQGRLNFCLLTENDLERGDDHIRTEIENSRAAWKNRALMGGSHGFLIVVVSPVIANARPGRPGGTLHQLASTLCDLYLGVGTSDEIHLDDVVLQLESNSQRSWRRWSVGVNYFSAQGDGRWWHDHRIPGGMAFSMNSVGHMARTIAERALLRNPGLQPGNVPREKLVYWALPKAMRTIGLQQPGSRRGTWLAKRGRFEEDREPPTFEQRQRIFGELAQLSENRYLGKYHTDETIPSGYFDEALWKEEDLKVRDDLAFTYLHKRSDPDYDAMGTGQIIEVTGGNAL